MTVFVQMTKIATDGPAAHGVPDRIIGAHLLADVNQYCGDHWVVVSCRKDGTIDIVPQHEMVLDPGRAHLDWLIAFARTLNRAMHANGHWVIVWQQHRKLVHCLWRDCDGDLQFTFEAEARRVEQFQTNGVDRYLRHCQEAYDTWREAMLQLQTNQREQARLALGEKVPTRH